MREKKIPPQLVKSGKSEYPHIAMFSPRFGASLCLKTSISANEFAYFKAIACNVKLALNPAVL